MSRPFAVHDANGDHTLLQASTPVLSPARQACPVVPLHLLSAPNNHCRFELVTVGRDHRIRATGCRGKALANGWCETHQHAQEVLELGAQLGYPRLELTAHRAVCSGKGCWEAYATHATPRWLQHDLPQMKALVQGALK